MNQIAVPQGYALRTVDEMVYADGPDGSPFRITDRYFDGYADSINYYTNGAISRAIEETIKRKSRADILDVGGGPLSRAAFGIARRYDDVSVTNIDICSSPEAKTHERLTTIQGDITESGLPAGSFDVVYSHQMMLWMPGEKKRKVLQEVQRVLRDDGVAVIDYFNRDEYIYYGILSKELGRTWPFFFVSGRQAMAGEVALGNSAIYITFRKDGREMA